MTPRHRDELRDLDSALAEASEVRASADFGISLMRDSLLRRREEVFADAAGVLDLALRGAAPGTTGAEISLVGKVLDSFQESLASVAQVLAGEPTSRGLIPGAIKGLVQLRVAGATSGSLQLRLVPANLPTEDSAPDQPMLLESGADQEADQEEAPLLDRSMERLIGLLSYGDADRDELLQDIADVGPRTTSHLQALSKAVGEAGANASLTWRSAGSERSAIFTRQSAERLARTLEEVVEESREVVFTGRLVGGSLVHRTFELEPDAEGASLVAGKVTEQVLPELARMQFGQPCTAHIEVREARLPSGETREAHLLTHLTD